MEVPANAAVIRRRRDAITRLGLLERAGDPSLTALARVAGYVAGGASAAIHVFDEHAQHRVAASGAPLGAHPRQDAMCRLVVDGERRIVCADASADARFAYSSFVTGPAPVRFYASLPLHAGDGVVVGTLCTWDTEPRDLSGEQVERLADLAIQAGGHLELVSLALDLGHVASHDALTGVANRLVLSDRLAHAFARQLRHDGEILVVVVDVDAFKDVNDTHGHEAGDHVLVEVARRLTAATRAEDTVARLGGDEFAVVAEVRDPADGAGVVSRIERAFTGPVTVRDMAQPVSVSIGAAYAQAGDDVRAALDRADRAMYARKSARA